MASYVSISDTELLSSSNDGDDGDDVDDGQNHTPPHDEEADDGDDVRSASSPTHHHHHHLWEALWVFGSILAVLTCCVGVGVAVPGELGSLVAVIAYGTMSVLIVLGWVAMVAMGSAREGREGREGVRSKRRSVEVERRRRRWTQGLCSESVGLILLGSLGLIATGIVTAVFVPILADVGGKDVYSGPLPPPLRGDPYVNTSTSSVEGRRREAKALIFSQSKWIDLEDAEPVYLSDYTIEVRVGGDGEAGQDGQETDGGKHQTRKFFTPVVFPTSTGNVSALIFSCPGLYCRSRFILPHVQIRDRTATRHLAEKTHFWKGVGSQFGPDVQAALSNLQLRLAADGISMDVGSQLPVFVAYKDMLVFSSVSSFLPLSITLLAIIVCLIRSR